MGDVIWNSCVHRVVVPGLALLVFFTWLGKRDVTTSHEARIVQTARVMAASGWPWAATPAEVAAFDVREDPEGQFAVPRFDVPPMLVNPWLVPVLDGQIRLQKPPLPNWCVATLFRLTGGMSEFATRFMPALFASIGSLLVMDLARLVLGRRAAGIAGLIWVSTLFIVSDYRESTPDPYLAFFVFVAVWAWVHASSTGRVTTALMFAFYVSLGLGVLAKGPFVFLHVAIALTAYAWSFPRHRRPRAGVATHVVGVLLLLGLALPWPIYIVTHVEHVGALWRMETTRGGGGGFGRTVRGAWEYLPRMFELTVPWTPLWFVGIVAAVRARGGGASHRRRMFALIWTAITVAIFSLSAEKKNAYLLPMLPAQTLLMTAGVLSLAAALRRHTREAWPRAIVIAQMALIGGIIGVGMWTLHGWGRHTWNGVIGAVLAIVAIVLVGRSAWHARRFDGPGFRRMLGPHAAGAAVACVLTGVLAHAVRDNFRSAKTFAAHADAMLRPPARVLVPRLPAEASVYLPLGMRYDPRSTELLSVIEPMSRRAFDVDEYRPQLPHGEVIDAAEVPVPGEPPNPHWRLIRLKVDPDTVPATLPIERATPGGE